MLPLSVEISPDSGSTEGYAVPWAYKLQNYKRAQREGNRRNVTLLATVE